MENLHLILELPPELPAQARFRGDLLPSLGKCLARGGARPAPEGLSAALCQAWGVARQRDWPLAPLGAARDGLDTGSAYWLLLEPAHLDVGMHGMHLRGLPPLSPAEHSALAQALAPLCAEHGAGFFAPAPGRLYLRFPAPLDLSTTPPDQVLGRQAMHHLPTGADAPRLMRLVNAAQMLLHDHPVNQAREQSGIPPVNSLWPWGGGVQVPVARRHAGAWGVHPGLLALAHASATPVQPCPARLRDLGNPASALVLLEVPEAPDANHLARLERDWLAPLLLGLQLGRIRRVELTVLDDSIARVELRPWHAWRLWRRPWAEQTPDMQRETLGG